MSKQKKYNPRPPQPTGAERLIGFFRLLHVIESRSQRQGAKESEREQKQREDHSAKN